MENYLFTDTLDNIMSKRKKGKESIFQDYFDKCLLYKWEINNKVYIGITTNIKVRFKNYLTSASKDHYIGRAIRKYDRSEIRFTIIEIVNNIEELKEREKYWIKYYNSVNSGYNLTTGGDHTTISSSTKNKMISSALNKKITYVYNIKTKSIELTFPSVRSASRYFNCNSTTIFAAIRNKGIFKEQYKVSYNNNEAIDFFVTEHKNKKVMIGNRNTVLFSWKLVKQDGTIFIEDSLKNLYKHCTEMKENSFIRIAYGRMKSEYGIIINRIKVL